MKFSLALLAVLGVAPLCHAAPVRLQIKGPDGQPIAGARVRVLESKGSWYKRDFLAPRDFSSDAQGNVAFESVGAPATVINDPSKPSLWARVLAPTFAVGAVQLKAGANALALSEGNSLEGVTLDKQQKPIAGVRLVIEWAQGAKKESIPLPNALALETRSDAQGHWRFADLPSAGLARLQVRDARFRSRIFELDLSQKAPPLFLERGVNLKGRLLLPDGKPAAGVSIIAGDYQQPIVTDAGGRFEQTGLGAESVYLQDWSNNKLPFLVVPQQVESLEIGEVRDIGDWKTVKGIRIMGRVMDSKTGKPIAGAPVSAWGKSMVIREGSSDKNGAFALTVSPDADILSIRPDGYLDFSRRGFSAPENGVIAFGPLSVDSAYRAGGVLVDEKGTPIKNASLYAEKGMRRDYARTDVKTGAFSFSRLSEGEHTIKVEGFKMVAPVKFKAGAGTKSALRVVVQGKKGTSEIALLKTEGRVVDETGNPVAGAVVDILFNYSDNGGGTTRNTVSQSDGTFKCDSPYMSANMTASVAHIYRPGYMRSHEEIEPEVTGNTSRISITMHKRGSVLRGRVVDERGEPAKNAFVALQDDEALPLNVNSDGTFTLEDMPATGVTLLASNGPSLASFKVEKAGQEITLVLPDAPAVANRTEIADTLLKDAQVPWRWKSIAPTLGQKRLLALMLKGVATWTWSQYLDYLAHHDSRLFLDSESALRTATAAPDLPAFELLLILARARSGNDEQKAGVRSWLNAQEKEKRDISPDSVQAVLRVAEVAVRLDAKEGEMWRDYALQLNDQLGVKNAGKSSGIWGSLAARISSDAPLLLSESWDTTGQVQVLASAMQVWREDGNVEAARNSWAKIEEMALDLAKHPVPRMRGGDFAEQPAELLDQARADYALLLSAPVVNPKYPTQNMSQSALKAAMAMTPPKYPDYTVARKEEVLVAVAQGALRNQQLTLIPALLDSVLSLRASNAAVLASAAPVADGLDAGYGAKFWTRAYAKARPDAEEGSISSSPTVAPYAKAGASKKPGQSRILIEREWVKRLQSAQTPRANSRDENQLSYDQSVLSDLTEAMANLAPARALEMLASVPDQTSLRAQTRTKIAVVLLSE